MVLNGREETRKDSEICRIISRRDVRLRLLVITVDRIKYDNGFYRTQASKSETIDGQTMD